MDEVEYEFDSDILDAGSEQSGYVDEMIAQHVRIRKQLGWEFMEKVGLAKREGAGAYIQLKFRRRKEIEFSS
jgi:hypothetical protein